MGDSSSDTVLERIAAAGRDARKARAMTLQKALRVTLAKVADSLMNLPMAVIGAVVHPLDGDDVEAALNDDTLPILLDGPGRCTGAMMIDPVVVGGLIQQQTIGKVRPDRGGPRAMTRTDAVICAPLIDALFERAVPILDDPDDQALIEGFRFGAKAEDARTLSMALDAQDDVLIRVTVDMERGARQGDITFVLPKPDARHETVEDDEEGVETRAKGSDLSDIVMGLNADLNMVICQLNVPLSALRAMQAGQKVPLAPGHFPSVQIVTRTGRVVGKGIVGHVDGVRAVKPQRKPLYASQPSRRASDAPNVDMPEVEDFNSRRRRNEDTPEDEIHTGETEATPGAVEDVAGDPANLPALASTPVALEQMAAEQAGGDADDLSNVDDLPDLNDLPNLADLPDLADSPDIAMKKTG